MSEKDVQKIDVSPVSIGVVEKDGKVMLVFDKVVSWVGIEPVQALKVAEQMKAAAVGILRNSPKDKPKSSGNG